MSIVNRAVKESKDVARLAVEAAKNELIEQMTPTIRAIIDGQLRAGVLGEDVAKLRNDGVNRMRQAQDYDGISDFEEGKDMKKDKVESVSALFPSIREMSEEDDMGEGKVPGSSKDDGGYDDVDETLTVEAEADDGMDEELEISESELEAMYAEALQLEVDVSKGFKDMAKPHEFGAGAKAQYQSDPNNLADMKSGEAEWDNVTPPEATDMIPEQIRQLVRKGLAENRTLVARNAKLSEMCKALHGKLSEMNLLNSKILHVNKMMAAHRLTAEQKRTVVESIDQGKTVKEVKRIFGILENTLRAAGSITESKRKPHADGQKARRTGGVSKNQVLRESADKGEGQGTGGFGRWNQLAGLKKSVNG